ncbi:lysozyme [Caulobacter mirabilis]|nr:lysozyme [Caulobacter mirabilis]
MNEMKMSREGALELIGHEAVVLTRYLDSKGIWTIGVGHTAAAGKPDPKTYPGAMALEEAIELFRRDLVRYEDGVNTAVTAKVSQTEFDALVSFHFNTGAIARAALTVSINRGDKTTAAEQFMSWRRPPEIVGRRAKEQKLFRDGIYSNGGKARLLPASADGKVQWGAGRTVSLEL